MEQGQLRKEIDHMRRQVDRQRREISQLEQAGIDTNSARCLLARMQDKVTQLSAHRDELLWKELPKYPGTNKVINGTPARRRA